MTSVPEIARRLINGSWVTGVAEDGGGGSQTWTESFNSDDLANLDDCTISGGTWVLGAGGVISQTDNTADDDIEKTCAFDLSAAFTTDTLHNLTGLAIAVECRADMAPGSGDFQVFGLATASITLGLAKSGSTMVVYEDFVTVVPQGTWSPQSYAVIMAPVSVLAGGVVMNDGGGLGGVPRAVSVVAGSSDLSASVGHLSVAGPTDAALLTKNGKGSFRKFRILGLYGLPALPA